MSSYRGRHSRRLRRKQLLAALDFKLTAVHRPIQQLSHLHSGIPIYDEGGRQSSRSLQEDLHGMLFRCAMRLHVHDGQAIAAEHRAGQSCAWPWKTDSPVQLVIFPPLARALPAAGALVVKHSLPCWFWRACSAGPAQLPHAAGCALLMQKQGRLAVSRYCELRADECFEGLRWREPVHATPPAGAGTFNADNPTQCLHL